MSSTTKNILLIIACLLGGFFVLKVALGIAAWALGLLVPVLVVGAILFILYVTVGRKALGGGGRRTLP
ncbi:MAG: hypothetical protein ACAH95_14140 [Fimbriimonas sp.]